MSLKLVIVGDLHLEKLGSVLSGFDHVDLQLECLHHASKYALDNKINRLVLLGDIFEHPHPSQKTIRRLLEVLCQYPTLNYYLIRGNHDVSSNQENSLEILDFIAELRALSHVNLYLSPTTTEIDNVPVCFLSWPYIKPSIKKPHLIFAHCDVVGARRDNGLIIDQAQLSIKDKTKNYWILGHLHRHQKGKRYLFPGTMMQMNFGEPLPKGFVVIKAKSGPIIDVKYKFINYDPPYKLINLVVSEKKDLGKIDSNPNYRYKVIIENSKVELPLDWRSKYPNVVKVAGVGNKKQLDQELSGQIVITEQEIDSIDIVRNLAKFLESRGFSKKDQIKGQKIIEQAIIES